MNTVGIVGTTAWGITLAVVLARQRRRAVVLARTPDEAAALSEAGESPRLPGVRFPDGLTVSSSPGEALSGADLVIIAVPSVTMRANCRAVASAVPAGTLIVSATKGIDIVTGKRMSQVVAEEVPRVARGRIGTLSGPNLAPEIAAGRLASATVAFTDPAASVAAQGILNSEVFRVYRSDDLTGVELGGTLKNIIAIGAGIIDGFSLGDNAKAAYVTRGLHEMTRLGVAMGARAETFAGLSGMGDLVATCYSGLSRNRRVGQGLARGGTLDEVLAELRQTAEGVPATQAAARLAVQMGVEMPITEMTRRVLFEGLSAKRAVEELMRRAPQPEVRF